MSIKGVIIGSLCNSSSFCENASRVNSDLVIGGQAFRRPAGAAFRNSRRYQLLWFDAQCIRENLQRVQRGVAPSGFHAAYIGPRTSRDERQLLLRELSFPAEPLHVQTKHSAKFHPTKDVAMRTMVRHTLVNIRH